MPALWSIGRATHGSAGFLRRAGSAGPGGIAERRERPRRNLQSGRRPASTAARRTAEVLAWDLQMPGTGRLALAETRKTTRAGKKTHEPRKTRKRSLHPGYESAAIRRTTRRHRAA